MKKPKFNQRFVYEKLNSETLENGIRHYISPDGKRLPSVTTILSEMKDMSVINNWKKMIGKEKAAEIVKESSIIGKYLHNYLENYLLDIPLPQKGNVNQVIAKKLVDIIAKRGLSKMDEFWGTEINLYYEGLYAGTTDLAGVHEKAEAILDFKNTRQPKSEAYIEDYKCQLVAYGLSHNNIYGTNIKKGVILMASREMRNFGTFQEFIISGGEWERYSYIWCSKLDKYYSDKAA